jgi:acetyl-CoA carboxylase biotin carboxyl carrier protein
MDIKDIRQLIKLVESSEIGELEIVEEGKKLRISKNSKYSSNGTMVMNPPMMNYSATLPASVPAAGTAASDQTVTAEEKTSGTDYLEIRSPMVGTFYRAPSPEADPYIEVGNSVESGQTLCIIEAMKLMNEIESEYSGKIAKIMVDNAQPVEFNQVLFLIEK